MYLCVFCFVFVFFYSSMEQIFYLRKIQTRKYRELTKLRSNSFVDSMRHFFVRIIGALEFNYSNLPAANLKKAAAVDGIEKN